MTEKLQKTSSTRNLLNQLLEEPQLVRLVQGLNSEHLCRVIGHVGLEDAGEIVALTTTQQLKELFDQDLWQQKTPGKAESFDADRFGLWLEIMLEMGATYVAQKVLELDDDFVTYAFSKHIIVVSLDELALRLSNRQNFDSLDDDALLEKALESSLAQEFDEYLIISITHERWDSILEVLLEIDSQNHAYIHSLFDRLAYISSEFIEDLGGLYHVLTTQQMLEEDIAGEREHRREQKGYVPPTAAASFLNLALSSPLESLIQTQKLDPVSKAHFRVYKQDSKEKAHRSQATPTSPQSRQDQSIPHATPITSMHSTVSRPARPPEGVKEHTTTRTMADRDIAHQGDIAPAQRRLLDILKNAGVIEESRSQHILLGSAPSTTGEDHSLLEQGLKYLDTHAPHIHFERREELNFLANLLIAGCSYNDRIMRPLEAAKAVVATCNLGLEILFSEKPDAPLEQHPQLAPPQNELGQKLLHYHLVNIFHIGWHILYHRLIFASATALKEALQSYLKNEGKKNSVAPQVAQIHGALSKAISEGKPWKARRRLGGLATIFDPLTIEALQVMCDQCATIPHFVLSSEPADRIPQKCLFVSKREQLLRANDFLRRLAF